MIFKYDKLRAVWLSIRKAAQVALLQNDLENDE